MNKERQAIQAIKEQGVLPLFYHDEASICITVVKTLYEAGIRCVEFTNRGTAALSNFKSMIMERDVSMPQLTLGIGTIGNRDDATAFIEAGADFLVSPFFDSEVCDIAYMNKILWIPGCMTATEIHTAQNAGCCLVKLFPGNVLGPGFVESVAPLFSGLDFMVTGGVDASEESIKAWFKSGAAAVGISGKLISKNMLQNEDYLQLKTKTIEVLAVIRKTRIA